MIPVTRNIAIAENEIKMDFVRSSGPGGQNVNKVATAVMLRFDIKNSPSLPKAVKKRCIRMAGSRISGDGVLVLKVQTQRKQEQNRKEAIDRLLSLIREAAQPPKPRIGTHPSRAARQRRMDSKHHRSRIKHQRKTVGKDDF